MTNRTRFLRLSPATLLLSAAIAGCGSPPATVDAGLTSDASADDAASMPDAHETTMVQISGTLVSLRGAPLPAATVIDALHPSVATATTDETGSFVLTVPAGERVQVEASRDGALTTILPVPPLSTDLVLSFGLASPTLEEVDATLRSPIEPLAPGEALVVLVGLVGTVPRAGITFTTDAPEIRAIAYDDGTTSYDPASATVETGDALALAHVSSETTLAVRASSARGRRCAAPEGWRAGADDTFAVPVRPDALTVALFECQSAAGARLVSGMLTEYMPGLPVGMGAAIGGATICIHGSTECTTTSRVGTYSIDVPNDVDLALTYDHEGYEGILTAVRAGPEDLLRSHALPLAGYLAEVALAFGATHDASAGAIEFFTSPDVTVSRTDGAADGPHYLDPGSLPAPSLTATSSRGWGFLFDIAPADSVSVRFEVADPTRSCSMIGDSAWASPDPDTVRVPVAAGHISFLNLRCP